MARRVPDLSKIRQLVGYKPRVQLDDILNEVISHEQSRVAIHV